MPNVKTIMEAYGVDYALTMERFMQQESLYIKILGMLFQDESLAELRTALAKRDLSLAFQAAHTLKGVSGNLGLTPLYDAVCTLVEPLRRGEDRSDYPDQLKIIEHEFEQVRQMYAALTADGV